MFPPARPRKQQLQRGIGHQPRMMGGLAAQDAMYSFTFRQIEVFLAICRAGNFSATADQLQVSQPAISNVIRSLESQLGVELFERRRGASCVLTREGIAFRDCAQQFLSQCEAIGRGARRGRCASSSEGICSRISCARCCRSSTRSILSSS